MSEPTNSVRRSSFRLLKDWRERVRLFQVGGGGGGEVKTLLNKFVPSFTQCRPDEFPRDPTCSVNGRKGKLGCARSFIGCLLPLGRSYANVRTQEGGTDSIASDRRDTNAAAFLESHNNQSVIERALHKKCSVCPVASSDGRTDSGDCSLRLPLANRRVIPANRSRLLLRRTPTVPPKLVVEFLNLPLSRRPLRDTTS